jgi:hypothetical protein
MTVVEQEYSTEGAYDLSIEAAAKRIQLVSQQEESLSGISTATTSNGGYFSDAEMSSEEDSEETSSNRGGDNSGNNIDVENNSWTDNSLSYSGGSGSDSDSVSGGDIESEISFLEKKQSILRKASAALKREESFAAFNARAIMNGEVPFGSKLWSEARTILDVLKKEGKSFLGGSTHRVYSFSAKEKRKSGSSNELDHLFLNQPSPKRPKIDLSMVERVSADMFENICTNKMTRTVGTIGIETSNHWMSQIMLLQIPALACQSINASKSFRVVLDPSLGPMVISPDKVPFQNVTQLTAALGLTSVAQ